jgi:hypothetical protein
MFLPPSFVLAESENCSNPVQRLCKYNSAQFVPALRNFLTSLNSAPRPDAVAFRDSSVVRINRL